MPNWRSNLSPIILHALYRRRKFTVIRAVVSSWFFFASSRLVQRKTKTSVSLEPVFVLYHFGVVQEYDVQKLTSTPAVVIIITNTITEMEHHFHTHCVLLYVCKFLGTRESFCKRKEFNPPRNFLVDQTKT